MRRSNNNKSETNKQRNFYEQVLRKRIITTVREVRVKIAYDLL